MDDVIGQAAWNKIALHSGRQCTATSKQTGERCKRAPIVGGFVCSHHGGEIPAVRKSARERLLAMVDPALDALLRALQTGPPCEHCGRSDADRDPVVLRAAQLVLDRAGYHPTMQVQVEAVRNPFADLSEDDLIAQGEQMLESAKAMLESAKDTRDLHRAQALPASTDGELIDDFAELPEGDDDAAIHNAEAPFPDGTDTLEESKGDK